ncbi:MAG: LamG domain-containing protein [Saprospiraceae bacterium]|nr:LamG domain-containing protein [Saprospiraceae bacterium]
MQPTSSTLFRFAGLLLFPLVFGSSLSAQVDLDKGLVGYWPFDSSGVNESPNLLPRTDFSFFNGASFSYGIEDNVTPHRALHFNDSSYVRLEQGIRSSALSFSLWFSCDDARGGTLLAWDQKGYGAAISSGGKVHAYVHLSSNNRYDFVYNDKNLADGEWHNLIVSFDGSEFRVYIDGTGVHRSSEYGRNKYLYYEGNGLNLGGIPTAVDKRYYTGRIDELLIYNRALTQHEINIIAGKGRVAADKDLETGLMVYLPFKNEDGNKSPNKVEATEIEGANGVFSTSCLKTAASDKMKFFNGGGEYLFGGPLLAFPRFTLSFHLHTTSSQTGHVVGWNSSGYQVTINPPGNPGRLAVRLWVSPTEYYSCLSLKNLNDGVCHHVLISFDGEFFKVFIDGQSEAEDGRHGPQRSVFYEGKKFLIGEESRTGSSLGFLGKIGEVYLYCRSLSRQEIEALRSYSGAPGNGLPVARIYKSKISSNAAFIAISNPATQSKRIIVSSNKSKMEPWVRKMLPGEHFQGRINDDGGMSDFKVDIK